MKKMNHLIITLFLFVGFACNTSQSSENNNTTTNEVESVGQSGVQDDASQKNVVQVAISSKDHTTLVTAIKAGELVDALSNAGPFTVFAPTNEAFNKLPAGTVDGLLKPASKETLVDILQYHVSVGVYKADALKDGQSIGQVNGDNVVITKKAGVLYVNGTAKIIASIPASNGIIHVIDGVLLPPKK
jgi:uncharacterized surface protein with fasciclin (FAS1) repeats